MEHQPRGCYHVVSLNIIYLLIGLYCRVVLFVADGLRAESFYKFGCNRTEFLRDVLLNHGIVRIFLVLVLGSNP